MEESTIFHQGPVNHMTYLGGVSKNPPDIEDTYFGKQDIALNIRLKTKLNKF